MLVSDLVPFLHVVDLARSIAFYEALGLELRDSYEDEAGMVWCWLEAGDARLMLARAGEPVEAERQAAMFYVYTQDLTGLRDRVLAAGIDAGEIEQHSAGPRRQLRLEDPDGYAVFAGEISAARAQAGH